MQSVARATETPSGVASSPMGTAEPPREAVHVIVYTTNWCPVCKNAKKWMSSQRIAFDERDVEASTDSARRMRAINPRGSVPTFDVEGQVLVGFSEGDLSATIGRAAERRRRRPSW